MNTFWSISHIILTNDWEDHIEYFYDTLMMIFACFLKLESPNRLLHSTRKSDQRKGE